MDNSSSWKTTISLTGQKISRIYLGNEVSLPSLCGSPIGPCPDLDKIKSNPSSYLVQTYFKIMSPFTLSLPCFLFPSGLLSHNLYAPLFHPTFAKRRQFFLLDLITLIILSRKLLMKLFIMQFSAPSSHVVLNVVLTPSFSLSLRQKHTHSFFKVRDYDSQ